MTEKQPERGTDPRVEDIRDCAWYKFASDIRDLRASGDYGWAEDTLAGIQATVERTAGVTAGQRRTVAAIRASERTPSRNFDAYGYGRRWR